MKKLHNSSAVLRHLIDLNPELSKKQVKVIGGNANSLLKSFKLLSMFF